MIQLKTIFESPKQRNSFNQIPKNFWRIIFNFDNPNIQCTDIGYIVFQDFHFFKCLRYLPESFKTTSRQPPEPLNTYQKFLTYLLDLQGTFDRYFNILCPSIAHRFCKSSRHHPKLSTKIREQMFCRHALLVFTFCQAQPQLQLNL